MAEHLRGWRRRVASGLVVGASLCTPAPVQAQMQPIQPFLVLNQERILTESDAGRALLAEEEASRDALRAEVREIDAAFEAEERRLTDLRPTLDPTAFRDLADAFDAEVVEARRDQVERSDALALEFDQRRRQFYARAAPVLVALMARFKAVAIFDEASVLLADQSLDITETVIAEIDAKGLPPAPPLGGDGASDPPEGLGPGAGEPVQPGGTLPSAGKD